MAPPSWASETRRVLRVETLCVSRPILFNAALADVVKAPARRAGDLGSIPRGGTIL